MKNLLKMLKQNYKFPKEQQELNDATNEQHNKLLKILTQKQIKEFVIYCNLKTMQEEEMLNTRLKYAINTIYDNYMIIAQKYNPRFYLEVPENKYLKELVNEYKLERNFNYDNMKEVEQQ